MSPVKRTYHAVYDLRYHFVWIPKHRRVILREDISKRVEEVFREVAKVYEFGIESMAVVEDHVHIFLSAPLSILLER
jgi:putative transposase